MDKKTVKRYAVIGDPVEHSRSPELYAPMFEKFGIKAEFERILVAPDDLERISKIAEEHELCGFAVTMPHKRAILPYLDELSAFANKAGSVNVVCIENGRLFGHSTDGDGVLRALKEAGVQPAGRTAVILGNGGAAMSAKAALEDCGCIIHTVSRQHAKTGRAYPIEDAVFGCEVASSLISGADILINATPLGMKNGAQFSDLSFVSLLKPSCVLLDMVYRCDRETALLKAAASRRLKTVSGERMLYHQGVLAFKLWTGCDYTE